MTPELQKKLEDYLVQHKFDVCLWQLNEKTKVRSLGVAEQVYLDKILGLCDVLEIKPNDIMIGSKYDELREKELVVLLWKEK